MDSKAKNLQCSAAAVNILARAQWIASRNALLGSAVEPPCPAEMSSFPENLLFHGHCIAEWEQHVNPKSCWRIYRWPTDFPGVGDTRSEVAVPGGLTIESWLHSPAIHPLSSTTLDVQCSSNADRTTHRRLHKWAWNILRPARKILLGLKKIFWRSRQTKLQCIRKYQMMTCKKKTYKI